MKDLTGKISSKSIQNRPRSGGGGGGIKKQQQNHHNKGGSKEIMYNQ